jgi:sensor domain CHASE-containing protein
MTFIGKILIIGLVIVLVILGVFVFYNENIFQKLKKTEKSPIEIESFPKDIPKELYEKLSAPENAKPMQIPEDLIKKLSAPENAKPMQIPEDLIKKLSAPGR